MGKFKLFSYNPPKKGVSKKDERASVQTDFLGFFYMLGRKFWNLSNLNLLIGVYVIALVGGFVALSGIPWAFLAFSVVMVILFGLFSTASTYIVRGYVRGDPVYIISDFKYAIKNNWKQGIVLGILDFAFIYMLIYDIFFWLGANPIDILLNPLAYANVDIKLSFVESMAFYGCIFLLFIYLMMRNYIYLLAVTFKLSIFKILKNSFIFAFVGLKRNILAFIGIFIVCAINFTVFISPMMMVGAVLPLIITLSLCSFIGAHAAYPVIKKYMITPYYDDEEVNEAYDSVFTDRE